VSLEILPVEGLPAVRPGDDLAALLVTALAGQGLELRDDDVLVVCQKVVSKAEGRVADLRNVTPSPFAEQIAREHGKDARVIELILSESRRIVRMAQSHLIVETHHGFVCANAGLDESNSLDEHVVILLPQDPDASAAALRARLGERLGRRPAVIVTDTFGRPWREGLVEFAIGIAGIAPILDLRGERDWAGRELHHTVVAVADELACAAGLVMEKGNGVAAVVVRGYRGRGAEAGARALLRDPAKDLFR
jgi:coenzyme F420-0:L-glutamate ligase / coenzyme F420-1:gamma-L-glutamate ligase